MLSNTLSPNLIYILPFIRKEGGGMGFRFSKRIKILPGVSVNAGKTGASVTVGGKGAKVTVGEKGGKTTVGLPGTGLSYTKSTKVTKTSHLAASQVCSSPQKTEFPLWVKIVFVALLLVILAAITK